MPNMRRNARALKLHRRCTLMYLLCFVICRELIYLSILPWTSTTGSAQSTIINKSRLRLLHKREEVLQQIFSAVREPSTPLAATNNSWKAHWQNPSYTFWNLLSLSTRENPTWILSTRQRRLRHERIRRSAGGTFLSRCRERYPTRRMLRSNDLPWGFRS